MIELKDDSLQQFIADEKNVVVQFSAGWCGNCRIMKPKFKKLATETEGLKFVLVDAEKFQKAVKWRVWTISQLLQLLKMASS